MSVYSRIMKNPENRKISEIRKSVKLFENINTKII
jgi:hypothetical protein